jgi:salicylate biosynthesis isochorismate synthase
VNNRPAPRAAQLVPEVFVVQPHSRPPALESTRAHDPLARGEQQELARAAVHLARRIGAAVLVRVHVSADMLDPWAAWGLLEAGPWGRVESAWAEPPGGTTLLAAGVAAQISTSLDGAASRCRPLFERWIDARADVPAAVAGFAFAPDGGQEASWSGFGAGRVVVPRVLVWRRGTQGGAVLARAVAPTDDARLVHEELESDAALLGRRLRELPTAPPPAPSPHGLRAVTGDAADRGSWEQLVTRARDAVAAGELDKLVVARRRAIAAPPGCAWHAEDTARALRAIEPHGHVFAVRGGDAWFVGATPEILAQVHRGQLATVALAGTRARGATPEEDERLGEALHASVKDRLEHSIVVDAIRHQLAGLSRAVHTAEAPRVARFRAVMHLETRVTAALSPEVGVLDVAHALHPTPAVSGAPRGDALAWLAREERLDRGWYAGPIGWLDAAHGGHLAVALRSARLAGDTATAYAGCGIVAASEPRAEWDETELKFTALARALSARPREDQA